MVGKTEQFVGAGHLPILLTILAIGVASISAGCSEAESPVWSNIHLVANSKTYSGTNPFASCTTVRACGQSETGEGLDCVETSFDRHKLEFPLPDSQEDDRLAICVECIDQTNSVVASGCTTPFEFGSTHDPVDATIFFQPSFTAAPTSTTEGDPTQPAFPRWGAAATELWDYTILIAGGVEEFDSGCVDWSDPTCIISAARTAEIYDPKDGTFFLADSASLMTQGRAFAAVVQLPTEEVAVFGGVDNKGEPTNTVDVFDPVGLSFQAGPSMVDTRSRFTASLISNSEAGYVLLVGGYGSGEGTWEVWNRSAGAVASGHLNESRWNHTATLITKKIDSAVDRNMVVLAGGEGGGEPGAATVRETVEIFDIDANQLDPNPILLCSNGGNPASKKTMHAAAFVPKRHFLYVAGGFKDSKHAEPDEDICVWHSSQEKWSGESGNFQLKIGRGGLTATALPQNAVLFAGGLSKNDGTLQVAQTMELVYEYINGSGETVVEIGPAGNFPIPMVEPRWDHGALRGADAKVLFFGGIASEAENASTVKTTELFNP